MAVPRDIDSDCLPESIDFFDIGGLQAVLSHQQQELMKYVPDAELIIEDEVSLYKVWTESQSDQYLGPYAEKFEQIRLQLLNEYRDQFSGQSVEKVDRLTRSLVHRMQSTFVKMIIKSQASN
jgi:glutamyl-tRNA reductase